MPELEKELIGAISDFSENLADIDFMKKYMKDNPDESASGASQGQLGPQSETRNADRSPSESDRPQTPQGLGVESYVAKVSRQIAQDIDSFSENLKRNALEPKTAAPVRQSRDAFPLNPNKMYVNIPDQVKQALTDKINDSVVKLLKNSHVRVDSVKNELPNVPQNYVHLISNMKKRNYEEREQLQSLKQALLQSPDSSQKGGADPSECN